MPETNYSSVPDASMILEAGPGSVALLHAESNRLVYVNKQFERVLGYSKDDVARETFSLSDILAGEQMERFSIQMNFVRDNPSEYSKYSVYTLKNKQGEEGRYYLYTSPLESNKNLYHLLIIPDLSSWNFPFNSFDARDLFLRQLETDKYGSFEWMIESGRLFWTDTLYDIYEIDKDTIITRETIGMFTHPDDAKKGSAAVQRALETSGKIDVEIKIVTGNKNVKSVQVLANVIKSESGQPVKLVGSVKDITSQRKIEQDLKRKVEELNRSNKELEEFAYVASHDLQEPLRKISTFSDRLTDKYGEILTGDGKMYLERMMASAENMRILINNLLEFSRVTRSTEPFSKVGLGFVIKQVQNELELVIEETGATFEIGKLPEIYGSLTQLSQLFTNIIGNAIKFRKADVAPIIKVSAVDAKDDEIAAHHLPDGVPYLKIKVSDNGIGFEEEYAARIFQIFQRLHGKSEYPGSGIGLAICKRIVENHQGALYATSTQGEGANFIIMLPAEQAK